MQYEVVIPNFHTKERAEEIKKFFEKQYPQLAIIVREDSALKMAKIREELRNIENKMFFNK
jgi:hypothetical protein